MRTTSPTAAAAGIIVFGMLFASGIPAAFADSGAATSTMSTSTPPAYCAGATTTEGYQVFTDLSAYGPGQTINFCLLDNTRTPLFLTGTHEWMITGQNGNMVFTPNPGTFDASSTGTSFFTDSWNGMTSSTTNAAPGTYRVQFSGFPGTPSASFMLMAATTTGTSTTSTGSTTPDVNGLIGQLRLLEGSFPAFLTQIQAFITQLMTGSGTTPPVTAGGGTIDQNGQSFGAGGSIDFSGRNFSHEADVTVSLNGQVVGHAHADGGGNFSTGSMQLPATAGTYTYTFSGNGMSVPAAVTVR